MAEEKKPRPFYIESSDEREYYFHDPAYTLTRDELRAAIKEAFKVDDDQQLQHELGLMVETVQHITWGVWVADVFGDEASRSAAETGSMNVDGQEVKPIFSCGCPLASISDWDPLDIETQRSAEIFQGYGPWDEAMSEKFERSSGVITITD